MGRGFSNLHAELVVVFCFNNVLCTVRLEKFTACFIVVEAKFISEEAERDISVPVIRVSIVL